MSYIGNTNTTQAFTPAIDYFSGTGSATAFTLSRPVASVAQVEAVVNNVVQNPSSAYTVSSNTITFTSAPSSGTNNIYVYYTSPITQVIAPSQGTVTTASLSPSLAVPVANVSGLAAVATSGSATDLSTGTLAKARLPTGSVLQVANYQFATYLSTTTQIPLDNTIPQITEGGQFLSLAITPTSATSKLLIQVNCFYAVNAAAHVAVAIFQDSIANAIAAQCAYSGTAGQNQQVTVNYFMTSGTTSSTTFTARIGANNANTISVNGSNSGTAFYGGVGVSSMTIMEIAA
jgi:hypothetical protein